MEKHTDAPAASNTAAAAMAAAARYIAATVPIGTQERFQVLRRKVPLEIVHPGKEVPAVSG
jgi:hypothetical protein